MRTPVSTTRQSLTEEASRVLDEAVAIARRRCHTETTSLHALSALLSLPSSLFRDARFLFRALHHCVTVSLDRLPSSNSPAQDPPPISNSLLATVKHSNPSIKLHLEHFAISILDDPVVIRVLEDAGFRCTDIKLAILRPPAPLPPPRYFLADGDVICRRISEVLAKSSGRNPLLVGACARDALAKFKKCVVNGKGEGVLCSEIAGLDLICVEREIMEFVSNGGSKEGFESKVKELCSTLDTQSGPGVVLNFGEVNVLVEAEDAVKLLVLKLSIFFRIYRKKMWLIGVAADYQTYKKFLNRFPSLEVDWDLHPLPITSSRTSAAELKTKSRLLRSFVPFGGFFSSPSNYRIPSGITNKTFTRCSTCNEKYEGELSAIKIKVSSISVADEHSSSLPSWLQLANSDISKTQNVSTVITDEKAESNAKVLWLQRKWDDTCKLLHQEAKTRKPTPSSISNDKFRPNLGSGVSSVFQKTSSPDSQVYFSVQSSCNRNLALDHVSSSSISSVTTELGLGTPASASQDYKLIVRKLTEKVPWQVDACYDLGQIISCRDGVRHHTWAGFIGSDKMGKRKMAEALSELILGSKEHLTVLDFSFDSELPDDISVRTGRKTIVDYITEELSKNPRPCLVFLLENVDKIDNPLLQRSLSQAIQTGKFLDSHGREISILNAIFMITCNSTEEDQDQDQDHSNFSEQSILEAHSWQMKIVIQHTEGESFFRGVSTNKRKKNDIVGLFTKKKPKSFFDLNLPLEDVEEAGEPWLKDFLEQVDRVRFKPFNFDPLADKILHKMSLSLQKSSGSGYRLEVDQEVMSQIIAASLCSDGEGPLDYWINEILGKGCVEAQRRYALHEQIGLKLVSCPGLAIDEQATGIRLPRMINLG